MSLSQKPAWQITAAKLFHELWRRNRHLNMGQMKKALNHVLSNERMIKFLAAEVEKAALHDKIFAKWNAEVEKAE